VTARNVAFPALGLLLSACAPRSEPPWHQEAGYRWRELQVASRVRVGFDRLAGPSVGLTHRNDVADERALANRSLLIGAGAALGDVDGDGRPDLFLTSVEGPAAL
jgi:hypothetical protein